MNTKNKLLILLLLLSLLAIPAKATSISGGQLIEDFTSLDNADLSASTGLWNVVSNCAQAARVADGGGGTYRPISFGDGSDGAVDTASGYTFDTDSHPNGYNFTSVNITGGTVTVTGTNPLIIYSLGAVTITPTISANGSTGSDGIANGSSVAPVGGTAITCPANGGAGGTATSTTSAAGGDGFIFNGTTSPSGGTAEVNSDDTLQDGSNTASFPGSSFDSSGKFICGGGGGGGGGYLNNGTSQYGTGGSGGAGGGSVHITAVGTLTVGNIQMNGGNGGNAVVADGTFCSGAGAGGNGGAVWLQSLADIPPTIPDPTVSGGNGGTSACGGGSPGNGGRIRLDSSPGNRPAFSTAENFDTDQEFPSTTSTVKSKAYDLGTLNAVFSGASTSQTTNGGSISVSYAGSVDNSQFSGFTSDITQLSNMNYRYLKIQMNFTTASVASAPPQISGIVVNFSDAGLPKVDLKLSGGCGAIYDKNGNSSKKNMANWALFSLLLFMAYPALSRATARRAGA